MKANLLGPIVLSAGLWACSGPDAGLPSAYRRLAVPEARLASRESHERGRALFITHCALCHGENADGHGVRQTLSSKPADFTQPLWSKQTSPRKIFRIIREGKPGTAMPAWKVLSEEESWDLVGYLLGVGEG